MEKIIYSVKDVSDMLGIGQRQAYDLVKSGRFPVKKVGNQYLIPKQPFHNWIDNGNMYQSTICNIHIH